MVTHRIQARTLRMKGSLITYSPLIVASGVRSEVADITPIRMEINGNLVPYIPGSSFKGSLRTNIESQLIEFGLNTCKGSDIRTNCGAKYRRDLARASRDPNPKRREDIIKKFCMACHLFGTQGYRGLIRVGDCYPKNLERYSLARRQGTGVDRRSGMVQRGALYSIEFIDLGSEFDFFISGLNCTTQHLALLITGLAQYNEGFSTIGGFSTKGFGKVRLLIEDFELKDLRENIVKDFQLPIRPDPTQPPEEQTKFLFDSYSKIWREYAASKRRKG